MRLDERQRAFFIVEMVGVEGRFHG
jgi:hypothetical protein